MEILIERFIANFITFFIVWKYSFRKIRLYEALKYSLDEKQVIDNIKNDRRYDWCTGKEENWKNTWNSNNPIEKKKITITGIAVRSFILYFFTGLIIEMLIYAVAGI